MRNTLKKVTGMLRRPKNPTESSTPTDMLVQKMRKTLPMNKGTTTAPYKYDPANNGKRVMLETRKTSPAIKQYGDKGYVPSNGIGVGY